MVRYLYYRRRRPITFRERTAASRLSAKQNVEYLQQLAGLYWLRCGTGPALLLSCGLAAYVASLVVTYLGRGEA